jgi:hypothetical protein
MLPLQSPVLTPSTCWLAAGTIQSMPHALDEHVPALAGPLPVASAAAGQQPGSPLTQMAGGADSAQALLLSRCVAARCVQHRIFRSLPHSLVSFLPSPRRSH